MMIIRVLVVDDSVFFSKRIKEILEEDPCFKVVGMAANGQQAVEMNISLRPDVITMDVDMPIMDGITAVKSIMQNQPCPILMLSAMTQIGAKATLDALYAGAVDFLPKQLDDIDENRDQAKILLRNRLRLIAAHRFSESEDLISKEQHHNFSASASAHKFSVKTAQNASKIDLLVFAASTGGPMAIQRIICQLPRNWDIPILILQHMPANFTKIFAERLNQLANISVNEAKNGDYLLAGKALLAPGGKQLLIDNSSGLSTIQIRTKFADELYSPCIDTTFNSLADGFVGHVLVVVLTGMGNDGKSGAIHLKKKGASIWAQDEASSIIYGMPKAIVDAHIADKILSLDEITQAVSKLH